MIVKLFYFIHGAHGRPRDWDAIIKIMRELEPNLQLSLIACDVLSSRDTDLGIDHCGEEVAHDLQRQLFKELDKTDNCVELNIVGHSLGGLVARCALGFVDKWLESRLLRKRVVYGKYVSLMTPHLGVTLKPVPLLPLSLSSIWSNIFALGQRVAIAVNFGTTGKQLLFRDSETRPLLREMARPDHPSMQTLAQFEKCIAIGVAGGADPQVPLQSACVTVVSLSTWSMWCGQEPDHKTWTIPDDRLAIDKETLEGLYNLRWDRFGVHVACTLPFFYAHSAVCSKFFLLTDQTLPFTGNVCRLLLGHPQLPYPDMPVVTRFRVAAVITLLLLFLLWRWRFVVFVAFILLAMARP